MADNIIEAIQGVTNDAKALEQDAKAVLDDMGCTLFKNKLDNLGRRADAFAPIAAGHASKPGAPWYEEVPAAQLKSMPDLYRHFEKSLGKNDKLCNTIDADIDKMIQEIDAVETLQGSLKGLVINIDMSVEWPAKTKAKEVKDRMIATRVEAHTVLAWHGTATHSKDQRMKAIGIVHNWLGEKQGDTKLLFPKIRELLQESGDHKPAVQPAKKMKLGKAPAL